MADPVLTELEMKLRQSEKERKDWERRYHEEYQACVNALKERDYNGRMWRKFEVKCIGLEPVSPWIVQNKWAVA